MYWLKATLILINDTQRLTLYEFPLTFKFELAGNHGVGKQCRATSVFGVCTKLEMVRGWDQGCVNNILTDYHYGTLRYTVARKNFQEVGLPIILISTLHVMTDQCSWVWRVGCPFGKWYSSHTEVVFARLPCIYFLQCPQWLTNWLTTRWVIITWQ